MKSRRRQVIWVVAIALVAFGVHWLASPASTSYRGGRDAPTRFDEIVDWVQTKARSIGKDIVDPPLAFLPAPALGPPGSLEVRVQETDGTAVEGVRLALFTPPGVPLPQDQTTGARGVVVWKDLPSAQGYFVRDFSQEGFARSVDVAGGRTSSLVLARPFPRIEGLVVDGSTHEPVSAATVELVPLERFVEVDELPPPTARRVVSTSHDGRFSLAARPARVARVMATAPDGRRGSIWRDSRRGGSWTIHVNPPRRIQGRVVDESGTPRAGLRVGARAMPTVEPAVTDADGRFSLEVEVWPLALAGTAVDLIVEGGGVPRFECTAPSPEPIRVVLPDAALDVQVRDAETDQGLPGVTLSVVCGALKAKATSDHSGHARVPLSPDTMEWVHVLVPGRGSLSLSPRYSTPPAVVPAHALDVPLRRGETRTVVIRVPMATTTVSAQLHDDAGRPDAGVRVELGNGAWRNTATSDGSGALRWVLPRPERAGHPLYSSAPDDEHWGHVENPRSPWPVSSEPIDLGPLVHRRGAALRLQVLDAAGRAVPRATADRESSGTGDDDGNLVLPVQPGRLAEGEPIDVQVGAPGFRRRKVRLPVPQGPQQVRDLEPIRLTKLERRTLRLVDDKGAPLASWRVESNDVQDSTSAAFSDSKGQVQVSNPSRDYSFLTLSSPGGEVFVSSASPDGDWALVHDDEIRVPSLREIHVRVVDPIGAPIESAQVMVLPQATTGPSQPCLYREWDGVDAEGAGHWKQVAGLPLKVHARASGFVPASVDLAASSSETVVVLRRRDETMQMRLRAALAERDDIDKVLRSNEDDSDDPKVLAERRKARDRANDRRRALDEEIERLRSDGWND